MSLENWRNILHETLKQECLLDCENCENGLVVLLKMLLGIENVMVFDDSLIRKHIVTYSTSEGDQKANCPVRT